MLVLGVDGGDFFVGVAHHFGQAGAAHAGVEKVGAKAVTEGFDVVVFHVGGGKSALEHLTNAVGSDWAANTAESIIGDEYDGLAP